MIARGGVLPQRFFVNILKLNWSRFGVNLRSSVAGGGPYCLWFLCQKLSPSMFFPLSGPGSAWGDDLCPKLLKVCYDALLKNGKIVLVESIISEVPQKDIITKTIFQRDVFLLHILPGAKERTTKEFEMLTKQPGFSSLQVYGSSVGVLPLSVFLFSVMGVRGPKVVRLMLGSEILLYFGQFPFRHQWSMEWNFLIMDDGGFLGGLGVDCGSLWKLL
ncbi:hypothetical protein V6N12_058346 [Hibiscus sabdariffa]|uniref:O-methyltransferase C-terminal domain-containing protein n=1 Tax=Hibiscus sabdariffa TaxID=183260 RepID=A0ABR2ERX7_9ROSI